MIWAAAARAANHPTAQHEGPNDEGEDVTAQCHRDAAVAAAPKPSFVTAPATLPACGHSKATETADLDLLARATRSIELRARARPDRIAGSRGARRLHECGEADDSERGWTLRFDVEIRYRAIFRCYTAGRTKRTQRNEALHMRHNRAWGPKPHPRKMGFRLKLMIAEAAQRESHRLPGLVSTRETWT
jgi:hypothetical protein